LVVWGPESGCRVFPFERWRDGDSAGCQGAHGSLTPQEMRVLFVLLKKVS